MTLFILIFLSVCQYNKDNSENITEIDLTENYKDTIIKLEDFASDIKLVRLETNENSLFGHFRGHIGKKHIIIIGWEKILQFSGDGKFICVIAEKGKGPGEFNIIDGWDVDESEQLFLYHDRGKNYIRKYNMDNRKFEGKIPLADKSNITKLNSIIFINDTLLAIQRGMFSAYHYLYFFQTTSGEIIEGKKKNPVPRSGPYAGMNPIFKETNEKSIIYQPTKSDTIYKINGKKMKSIISLDLEKPHIHGNVNEGSHASFLSMDKEYIFLRKIRYRSEKTSNSANFKVLSSEYLRYNRSNNETYKINSLFYDYLGIELSNPIIIFQDNKFFAIKYEAISFKDLIDNTLKNNNISKLKKNKLKQLNKKITENDNPILITGKYK